MPLILASWEANLGRIEVPGQPRQKSFQTPSEQKKLGMVVELAAIQ
jgi:hypothetical protein